MSIQGNRSDGVASDRRLVCDERRQCRSPVTVAGDDPWRPSPAIVAIAVSGRLYTPAYIAH